MTGRAKGLCIGVPVLVVLAWLLGYPVLSIVCGGGILLLIAASLLIAKPPTDRLEREIDPAHVTRGESATVRLIRRNRSPIPAAALEATDKIGHLTVDLTIPLARPAGRSQASYRFVTARRGHLTIGPAVLSRRDPWGVFRRSRVVGDAGELLVYPRVLPIPAPEILGRLGRDAGAADVAAGSDRFHTLREYVVGDELRKIHWPSSARTGTLVVKQMVDSPQPRLLLYLDCESRAYPDPEAFEEAVDIAASLAHVVAATGLPLTIAAGHGHAAVDVARPDGLAALLDTLAIVQAEQRAASASTLRALAVHTRATAIVGVTGPGNGLLTAMTGVRSLVSEAAIYRLGAESRPKTLRRRGLVVHDAATAQDLIELVAPRSAAPRKAR